MAYKINFKSSVLKDLKKIPKKTAKLILDLLESELSSNPEKFPELKGKFKGLRKYRHKDYRVIYTILEDSILITRIRHRKDVYKN